MPIAMQTMAEYCCAYCGEPNLTFVDFSAGATQSYGEDCQVCCRPILQAQSACLSHWLPYLSHRDCQARSHMQCLNYFVHNAHIDAETFYVPLLKQFLEAWEGMAMLLTLDTSVRWDQDWTAFQGLQIGCV